LPLIYIKDFFHHFYTIPAGSIHHAQVTILKRFKDMAWQKEHGYLQAALSSAIPGIQADTTP
jgi:hypothetical protein